MDLPTRNLQDSIIADFFCINRCRNCPLFAIDSGAPICNLNEQPQEKCAILIEQLNLTP